MASRARGGGAPWCPPTRLCASAWWRASPPRRRSCRRRARTCCAAARSAAAPRPAAPPARAAPCCTRRTSRPCTCGPRHTRCAPACLKNTGARVTRKRVSASSALFGSCGNPARPARPRHAARTIQDAGGRAQVHGVYCAIRTPYSFQRGLPAHAETIWVVHRRAATRASRCPARRHGTRHAGGRAGSAAGKVVPRETGAADRASGANRRPAPRGRACSRGGRARPAPALPAPTRDAAARRTKQMADDSAREGPLDSQVRRAAAEACSPACRQQQQQQQQREQTPHAKSSGGGVTQPLRASQRSARAALAPGATAVSRRRGRAG